MSSKAPKEPVRYSKALGDEICRLMAEGMSLNAISRMDGMPTPRTITDWSCEDRGPGFASQYAQARSTYLDRMADEIIDISDNMEIGETIKEDANGQVTITKGDMIRHRQLRIDTRKWYLAKLAPKRYGDRLIHSGDESAPITTVVRTIIDPRGTQDSDG